MSFYNSEYVFYIGLAAIVLILFQSYYKIGHRPAGYPPGPPTLPFIGNLHQIPRKNRHLQFEKWARQYGPLYSLILGTKVMVVLNSDLAVKDLLDKRGSIYSSRPESYIGQNVLSGGLRVLFMPNHGVWTMVHKLARRILNVSVARTYVPYQDLENKSMLLDVLENPSDFINHLRRYTSSLTTQMTFGFRTVNMHDARIKEAFDIFDRSGEMIGSRTAALFDLVPALRYLPDSLVPMKIEAKAVHRRELKLFRGLFLSAKQGLVDGTTKPCVCVDLVQMQREEQFSDDLAGYIGGSLLQAGSETTAAILVGFVQAMVIFPEVVEAAQKELDRVCGDRMPDLNDVPDLPYIRSCAKESLRWMPGFMLGIPHSVTQDDTYMGYHIPKASTVIINVWAIHNDPQRHPNPRQFDPLRYIDDHQTSIESSNSPDATKRDHFAFGAGRRKCQGMHIADRSIFLAIARLLWAFNFHKAIDGETGDEIIPDMDNFVDSVMMFPQPFVANINPRSASKAEQVRNEWDRLSTMLDENGQWREVPEGLIWKDEQITE